MKRKNFSARLSKPFFKTWLHRVSASKGSILVMFIMAFMFLSTISVVFNGDPHLSLTEDDLTNDISNEMIDGTSHRAGEFIYGVLFWDELCPCKWDLNGTIQAIAQDYPFFIPKRFEVNTDEGKALLNSMQDAYATPTSKQAGIQLYIGDYFFFEEEISYSNVTAVLDEYSGQTIPVWPDWTIAWRTNALLFYDNDTGDGAKVAGLVENMTDLHFNVELVEIHAEPRNILLLEEHLVVYSISDILPEAVWGALFIGDDALINDAIDESSVNATIGSYAGQNTTTRQVELSFDDGDICVIVFYSSSCGKCTEALIYIDNVRAGNDRLRIVKYNIAKYSGLMLTYAAHFNLSANKVGTLLVVLNDTYYTSPDSLKVSFEKDIDKYPNGSSCLNLEEDKKAAEDQFRQINVLPVLLAGLIDGINPCAFATLIFFISYLTIMGHGKRDILIIGISFTLGIFLTYLLLGIGLYEIVGQLTLLRYAAMMIYPLTALFALIMAIYSFYDFFKARSGHGDEMKLQLPGKIKKMIDRYIKKQAHMRYLPIVAVMTGAGISLLEFMCTGQVYLPTIVYIVASSPSLRGLAMIYLILYNLMFILPLVVIFVAVYFGLSSERLYGWLVKSVSTIKILTALLFVGLTIFMVIYTLNVFDII